MRESEKTERYHLDRGKPKSKWIRAHTATRNENENILRISKYICCMYVCRKKERKIIKEGLFASFPVFHS